MELQNDIQTLSRLGLTTNQAKVYLALAALAETDAKTISQRSGVDRPDVYRVMLILEKLGLVEKTISVPSKFRAISMSHAVSMLIDNRNKETMELQTKSKELIAKFKNNNANGAFEQDASQFIMIPKKEADLRKRLALIHDTRNDGSIISSQKRLRTIPLVLFEEVIAALQRGAKIRVITKKPEDEQVITETVGKLMKTGNFEMRYTLRHPPVLLSIFDKKEALITTKADAGMADSPALWTNNSSLVEALQDYFEILWLTSIQHDHPALANITG